MMSDKVYLDSANLRQVAKMITDNGRIAEHIGKALPGLSIELPPSDPLRIHRHFLAAFTEFTTAWSRQTAFVAEAAGDIATGLTVAADTLLEEDRQIAERAKSFLSPPRDRPPR